MCSAINEIDFSALESLEAINARLRDMGIKLHLSEVKGPVMDRLKKQHFISDLTGSVFLSQHAAYVAFLFDRYNCCQGLRNGVPQRGENYFRTVI